MDNISTTWIYNEQKKEKYNKNNIFIFSNEEKVTIDSNSDMLINKELF